MLGYFIIFSAFVLGFSLSRASTCTVAATTRWVRRGKPDWLIGISVAVCWSAVALTLLKLVFTDSIPSPAGGPINWLLVMAAVTMGLGAYLNQGCFIGSVGRLSSGEPAYLLTFAGLAVARKITGGWPPTDVIDIANAPMDLSFTSPGVWLCLLIFFIGAVYGLARAIRNREPAMFALCVMGIAAALTFASNPDWSYEAWVGRIVSGQRLSQDLEIELTIFALFAGAIISSVLNGKFELKAPGLRQSVLHFTGGILMGIGAKYAPGGNDTLLLWAIPSFVLYGLVAYAIMVATVALLVLAKVKIQGD